MRKSQTLPALFRLFRNVILFDVLVFLSVGIICLLAGWQTVHQYGNALVWTGVLGLILLLVTGPGWRNARWDEWAALSRVIREHELFYLFNRERDTRARFMLVGVIALLITLAIGLIFLMVP